MTTNLLIALLAVECGGMILWGLAKRGRIYQFPFLAGVTWAGFVLPQLIGLRHDPYLPAGALGKTTLMMALCAGMIALGYQVAQRPFARPGWTFDRKGLSKIALLLSMTGAYFFYKLSRLPDDVTTDVSQWSGTSVAYLFLAQILTYGFVAALFLFARWHSKWGLALAVFGSSFYLDRIIFSGRRGDTLEFFFLIVLSFWFWRKKAIPRLVMLALVLGGTLMLHSTGDYRGTVIHDKSLSFSSLMDIPYIENLQYVLTHGGEEVREAAYLIYDADLHGNYDFGAFHWNTLVFNYVPAQWLGEGFKQSLLIKTPEPDLSQWGYTAMVGATTTGATDSFISFWYFGCLKFFVIGYVMRRLWEAAMAGSAFHQMAYCLILTPALHTITHHTQWFVSPWIHILIFFVPALRLIRRPLPLAGAPAALVPEPEV